MNALAWEPGDSVAARAMALAEAPLDAGRNCRPGMGLRNSGERIAHLGDALRSAGTPGSGTCLEVVSPRRMEQR